MPVSICGSELPSPIQSSRNGYTATIMSPCCQAASLPAKRTEFNPGANFIRLALVANLDETLEAARRIAEFR